MKRKAIGEDLRERGREGDRPREGGERGRYRQN